jgi:hypothetical protein
MDVRQFTSELLQGLSDTTLFNRVALQTEGPIVNGRAFAKDDANVFLRFYFNSLTGTLAFALIENEQRVWGIDFDNRRGWHMHPLGNPTAHEPIAPMTVSQIVTALHIARNTQSLDEEE